MVIYATSISAQNYHVTNKSSNMGKHGWGHYQNMTATIGDNSGSVGNVAITVTPNKVVEVKNNTSIIVRVNVKINHSVDKHPDQYDNAMSDYLRPNEVWRIPYRDSYMILVKDVKLKDWKRP